MGFKENSVEDWFEEIRYGLEYRFLYGMEKDWARIEAMFYNGHPSCQVSGSNIIYSTGDAFLSQIHNPNPRFLANPTRLEQVEWAPIVENLDNDIKCQTKMKQTFYSASLFSYLWGVSVVKLGYDSEFGYDPSLDINGTKEPYGITLSQFNSKQRKIEYSDNKPGMPWLDAVPPHDIVVPWGTRDLNNCPWIAHRVCRHIDDIKTDMKYSGLRELQPVMSMRDFVESYQTIMKPYRIGPDLISQSAESTGEAEYVELWEIHDKRTRKIYVIATGHDKFLRNDVDHLQIFGLPFVEVGFVPKGRTFWRTSDAIYLLNHQAELADITRQARKQRRLQGLKFLMRKGSMDDAEKRKLLSPDIGATAEVDTKGAPLADTFIPVPSSAANLGLYQEQEDVRSSARETVGFDRNSYGEYKGARTTATEVQAVQQSKQARMGRRQTCLADAYVEAIKKINGFVFKFWTLPRVAQVMNQQGMMEWMQYVPSTLAGNYDLDIAFEDAPQDSMEARQQEAMQAVQMSMTDPTIDPLAARRLLARSFPNAAVAGVFKPGVMSPLQAQGGGQPQGGTNPAGASQNRLPQRQAPLAKRR